MQIVINMSEKEYNYYRDASNFNGYSKLREIVLKGTPLPSNHGRLIDENELWDNVPNISSPFENHFTTYDFQRFIENTSTIVEADKEMEER